MPNQTRRLGRGAPDRREVAALQLGLRLTTHQAAILAALYRAMVWVPIEELSLALAALDESEPGEVEYIAMQIHNLRTRLGAAAVLCMRDRGYTLGAPGVRECRRLLGPPC
jgi:hypothetical protein